MFLFLSRLSLFNFQSPVLTALAVSFIRIPHSRHFVKHFFHFFRIFFINQHFMGVLHIFCLAFCANLPYIQALLSSVDRIRFIFSLSIFFFLPFMPTTRLSVINTFCANRFTSVSETAIYLSARCAILSSFSSRI